MPIQLANLSNICGAVSNVQMSISGGSYSSNEPMIQIVGCYNQVTCSQQPVPEKPPSPPAKSPVRSYHPVFSQPPSFPKLSQRSILRANRRPRPTSSTNNVSNF